MEQNFTPIDPDDIPDSPAKKVGMTERLKQAPMMIGLFALVIVALGAAIFYIQQPQTIQKEADIVPAPTPASCHEGQPPLPIDPRCEEFGPGCPAPRDGYCKLKSPTCYECRYPIFGLRIICGCQEPTPTGVPNITPSEVCAPPLFCAPPELCAEGSIDKNGSQACKTGGVCCIPEEPTPTVKITPTPTQGPTPSACPVPPQVSNLRIICPVCDQ